MTDAATTSVASEVATFAIGALASTGASALLASRIERIGGRLRVSEALLGMMAALAADSPEITSSVTALRSGQHAIGIGVVLGSNVFNLAALLGLGAVVAGRIPLHRRVVVLEGTVALAIAAATLLVVTGAVPAAVGLALALVVFLPYLVVIGVRPARLGRLGLPTPASKWLAETVHEEELELEPIPIGDLRRSRLDFVLTIAALAVVIGASIAMEHAGVKIGAHYGISTIVTGAVILAAITSLPNAVAAVYLARRSRGPAVLSEAMNSNALNVVVGLMLTGTIIGLGGATDVSLKVAWWYAGLTLACLAVLYARRGISRTVGMGIIAAYAAFVLSLVH